MSELRDKLSSVFSGPLWFQPVLQVGEFGPQLGDQLRWQLWDQLWSQIGDHIMCQFGDRLVRQLYDQIYIRSYVQIYDQLDDDLHQEDSE